MRFHPVDDCAGRQVCVIRAGAGVAGQGCTIDNQCASGSCLSNNSCFTACAEDVDCPGSMTCGLAAAEIAVSATATMQVNACGL